MNDSETELISFVQAHLHETLTKIERLRYQAADPVDDPDGELSLWFDDGSSPSVVLMDHGQRVLIGHDTSITCVDVKAKAIIGSVSLGVFFEFIPVEAVDEIIVVDEIGALRIEVNAMVKWSVDCDVIEDFVVDDQGRLILSTMDDARLAISLQSGAVSR